jgi:hypothetical protein
MDKYFISDDMTNKIIANFGSGGGVYILKCDNGQGAPISVNRVLLKDDEGVLYIGKAENFSDRVASLKKSISPEYASSSHECGARYKANPLITTCFPYDQLYVFLVPSDDPRATEAELLTNYESKFGELPPLNRVS